MWDLSYSAFPLSEEYLHVQDAHRVLSLFYHHQNREPETQKSHQSQKCTTSTFGWVNLQQQGKATEAQLKILPKSPGRSWGNILGSARCPPWALSWAPSWALQGAHPAPSASPLTLLVVFSDRFHQGLPKPGGTELWHIPGLQLRVFLALCRTASALCWPLRAL